MEKEEFYKLGAFCVQRMSLRAQREISLLTINGSPFNDIVLSEIKRTDKGRDFIAACEGKLGTSDFWSILTYCDQPTLDRIITDISCKDSFLDSKEITGHFVLENAAIYYSKNMEATISWFEKTLGWQGVIEARDESGNGTYGLIVPHIKANTPGNRKPYLQLMKGEPSKSVVAFIKVWGLVNLRQKAIDSGWTNLTSIEKQLWGAHLFVMTTCDESLIQFYEPDTLGF